MSRQITSGSGFLRELKPRRERITVQSRKTRVTSVWNPTEFYRIVALPKGMKFNAEHYISLIYVIHSPRGEGARWGL
jgi:hypothetical protein